MATATSYKRFNLKTVEVTIAIGAPSGVSSADRELINGTIIGHYPSSNQDQLIDSIALTATTGVITVTLAANATAENKITVVVMIRD
jgi:hypothetical protein